MLLQLKKEKKSDSPLPYTSKNMLTIAITKINPLLIIVRFPIFFNSFKESF